FDHARILAEESAKMKWCLPEIANLHTHGMEVMGPASRGARPVPTNPGPIPTPQGYVPGPAYFGTYEGAPTAITPAFPPGFVPPRNPAGRDPAGRDAGAGRAGHGRSADLYLPRRYVPAERNADAARTGTGPGARSGADGRGPARARHGRSAERGPAA